MRFGERFLRALEVLTGIGPGIALSPMSSGSGSYGVPSMQSPEQQLQAYEGWIYKSIDRRSEDVAGAKRFYEQRTGEDEFTPLPMDHALVQLMARPNPWLNGHDFIYLAQTLLDVTGNTYILCVPNAAGFVAELYLLDPRFVTIVPGGINDQIKGYIYQPGTARYFLTPEQVLHMKYPNPRDLYFYGLSPLQAIVYDVAIARKMKVHQLSFLDQHPASRMAIEVPGRLNAASVEDLRRDIKEHHTGVKAGVPLVVQQGSQVKTISTITQEVDYLKTSILNREEIVTAYGVPPSILGITGEVKYSNAEAAHYAYSKYTLEPLARKWDRTLTESLARSFGDNIVVRHEDLVPKDQQQVRENVRMNLQEGVLSINEVRQEQGLEPIPGGDEPMVGLGRIPLSAASMDLSESEPESKTFHLKALPTESRADSDLKPLAHWRKVNAMALPHERRMTRAFKKFFLAQLRDVRSRIPTEKSLNRSLDIEALLFDLDIWNDALVRVGLDEIMKTLPGAWDLAMEEIDLDTAFTMDRPAVERMMTKSLEKLKDVNSTTSEALRKTLTAGNAANESLEELEDRILGVFKQAGRARARVIAKTTVNGTVNTGMQEAWVRSGIVEKKGWLDSRSSNFRQTHRDARKQEVPISEPFIIGGEPLMYPGDPEGSAENIINCGCWMYSVLKKK